VASIAINRKEKLITYDNDFLLIKGAAKEIGHILNLEIPE
jgi:predicted nucleic acid-binding protein